MMFTPAWLAMIVCVLGSVAVRAEDDDFNPADYFESATEHSNAPARLPEGDSRAMNPGTMNPGTMNPGTMNSGTMNSNAMNLGTNNWGGVDSRPDEAWASEPWTRDTSAGVAPRREPASIELTSFQDTVEASYFEPFDLFVGYNNGFVIASDEQGGIASNRYPFLMRINSWFQLRHTLFESNGRNIDQNTFSFERLRLSFGGHAFSPAVRYFMQFDANSDRETEAIFLDYFVTYDVGRDVFGLDANHFGLKAGKWKVPFSRSREESGRRLQFTDRATSNILFDLNRSVGVGMFGRFNAMGIPINWESAVSNGFKTGSLSTSRTPDLDRDFGWSFRAANDPIGDFGREGEPDLSFHQNPALRVGTGLAHTRVGLVGMGEFGRQRGVDSGDTISSLLPAGVDKYDLSLFTIDSHFKYRGFSFITEYSWRYMSNFRGGNVLSLTDHGLLLQTGYFICPEKLELLARWSRIVGDSGTLGLVNQSSDEVGVGGVWYLRGHNAKLTMDVTRINGVPISSSRLEMRPGDSGWLMRTQLQLAF